MSKIQVLAFAVCMELFGQETAETIKPPLPTLIEFDREELLEYQTIIQAQEVLRLRVCLKRNLSMEECGPWRDGHVMKMPKSEIRQKSSHDPTGQQ